MSRLWKCTKCQQMVDEKSLKKHKCSLVADLKERNTKVSGVIELAYLRGKQESEK